MREPFAKFIETELSNGFLLIACGLPGTWKTETIAEVSRIKGCPLLRTDLIRLEVLKSEDIFDEKVASSMDKREKVYETLHKKRRPKVNYMNILEPIEPSLKIIVAQNRSRLIGPMGTYTTDVYDILKGGSSYRLKQ